MIIANHVKKILLYERGNEKIDGISNPSNDTIYVSIRQIKMGEEIPPMIIFRDRLSVSMIDIQTKKAYKLMEVKLE